MFGSGKEAAKARVGYVNDLSFTYPNPPAFELAHLMDLGVGAEVTCACFDPVQSLLAVASHGGRIHILGRRGVDYTWANDKAHQNVKFMAFNQTSLVTVTEHNLLSVWNLRTPGHPKRESIQAIKSPVTSLETSFTHGFVFLGCTDGTVELYDTDRGCIPIQSRIPNLWVVQEEILRRSNTFMAPVRTHIPVCTDVKLHPIDLNLLLIAYEGGVALYNLAEKRSEKSWEFVIPPGAVGGGGTVGEEIFTERRSGVVCLAWRPDGLVFAAGHEDGCISFASVEDENPLSIRTLERMDVNKTTEEDLFGWSADDGSSKPSGREPVFKLAWSAFPEETIFSKWTAPAAGSPLEPLASSRKKGTILTILGGLLPDSSLGVHTLDFPPYQPPALTASTSSSRDNISAPMRAALRESITSVLHDVIPSEAVVEDFLLFPSGNPHYGGGYDPVAIMLTTGVNRALPVLSAPHASNDLTAYAFPPLTSTPTIFSLPSVLSWSGKGSATVVELVSVEPRIHHQLVSPTFVPPEEHLSLMGGAAFPLLRGDVEYQGEKRYTILVAAHADLSITFADLSPSLLGPRSKSNAAASSSTELQDEYPRPLAHLTICLRELLLQMDEGLSASRLIRERPWDLEVTSLQYASLAGEVVVGLNTDEVIILRFTKGTVSSPTIRSSRRGSRAPTEAGEIQVIDLSYLSQHPPSVDSFVPLVAITWPPLNTSILPVLALSNVGFFAAASSGRLLIVDLRAHEEVLLWDDAGAGGKGKGKGKKDGAVGDGSLITGLEWCISGLADDPEKLPRLLVCHASGLMRIITLSHVVGNWILSSSLALSPASIASSFKMFTLDTRGNSLAATPSALQQCITPQNYPPVNLDPESTTLLITVAPRRISTWCGLNGPRLFTTEGKGYHSAQVVERDGAMVLVVFGLDREIEIFSLPDLLVLDKMRFIAPLHSAAGTVSCTTDGEIIQFLDPLNIKLFTLFDFGRYDYPPTIQLYDSTRTIPAAVSVLSSVKSNVGWYFGIKGKTVHTPAQMEVILGGPNRPLPREQRLDYITHRPQLATPARVLEGEAATTTDYLAMTTEALQIRGERLNQLGEAISEMAVGAQNYALEARRTAAKEAKKTVQQAGVSAVKGSLSAGFSSLFKH